MRLILEEDGEQRRFKLKEGTFTVGSSEDCTITLASEDVAAVHMELHVEGDEVSVAPRKGVSPVKVGGISVKERRLIKPGQKVLFGSAVLQLEKEGAPAKAGAGAKGTRATASAGATAGGQRVRRQARRPQGKSLPTWAILLIAVAGIAIAYKVFVSIGEGTSQRGFSATTSQARIERAIQDGDYKTAEDEFLKVDAQQLSPEWNQVFSKLRQQMQATTGQGINLAANLVGTKYLDSQLKKFKDTRLAKNGRPEARVFVRRADYFLGRWPDHPEADWVKRMRTQFWEVGRMDEPPTLEDVTFEAKTLTWAFPRNYKQAFAVLRDFRDNHASPAERTVIDGLIQTHEGEQKAYFDERLDLAAGLYEEDNRSQALEYCIQLVIGLEDGDMVANAAERITKMAGVEKALTGLKRDRPEDFEALAENSMLRKFFQQKGLL